MGVFQNFQKIRVRVWKCHKTHRSSGYCGTGLQNSQKLRAGTEGTVPRYPGYCGTGVHPELTEVPGTGMNALQNLHKFWVRVIPAGKCTPLWGEVRFEVEGFNPTCMDGMFSLGPCLHRAICRRFKGIMNYRRNHHRERRSIVNPSEWRPGQQPRSRLYCAMIIP